MNYTQNRQGSDMKIAIISLCYYYTPTHGAIHISKTMHGCPVYFVYNYAKNYKIYKHNEYDNRKNDTRNAEQ